MRVIFQRLKRKEPQVENDPIMKFFEYNHLTNQRLRATSLIFWRAAQEVVASVPSCAERTVALRKLLEAKDAAVRAALEET